METDRIARLTALPPLASFEIEVEVSDTQSHLTLAPQFLQEIARRVVIAQGIHRASISIAVVDDPTIRVLNARHLGHDWPTDVISFGLSEPDDPVLAGELVVSAEMAAATAREVGADPQAELALYVVHGLLHLCGLDDQSAEDSQGMRRREGELLADLGLINTFPLAGPIEPADQEREGVRWPR